MRITTHLGLLTTFGMFATSALASVSDTFDNNVNLGTWRLTTNPNRLYQIEPTGGRPGAYLHAQVATAVPTWFIDNPAGNPFLGDYAAEGVGMFTADMLITGGPEVPNRNMTLHLLTTLGTGDPTLGIEAYYVGRNISRFPNGWAHFTFPLRASSASIPPGWVVTRGNGDPGTDSDWQMLVRHVENVNIALGTPGFAYPNLGLWDLGLDNVTLVTRDRAMVDPIGGLGARVLPSIVLACESALDAHSPAEIGLFIERSRQVRNPMRRGHAHTR